ncbi:mannose-6-phosphate receptor binding domain-containing protein [Microdochium trichocladiopsis]|uniref:Mannose-6-phosphate receptor binding domain-containing protein n=1 Tax=Microdochium trichocladiopsis TaxID=1682393 RepID=A0A9P8YCL9_9PEZI|nr:mannose-6-phosphate receptor binding domain-containing protein [Microdochium trichocladiopsis]KAH7038296.1 mannose-6-phosphate receptor binding domain-containing protein [Microdochium trichocladiopsis]
MRISSRKGPSGSSTALLALVALATPSALARRPDADKTTTTLPCTATSTSGAFYDLRADIAVHPKEDGTKPKASLGGPTADYHPRGWDYGANFTLNICAPVVEPFDNVKDIEEGHWQNISAYYQLKGEVYSLGFASTELVPRGKELVLQYSGGSYCEKKSSSSRRGDRTGLSARGVVHDGANFKSHEDESSDKDKSYHTLDKSNKDRRRKSATIMFTCDKDPTAGTAVVSFIAADPEECNYVFKVRSQHACAGAEPHKPGSVGPGSVFAIIFAIAVLVYLLGGIFYNRTINHSRGWKQLPNYSLWAGLWSFLSDFFIIATSSCARLLPNRRGYHHLSGSPTRGGMGRDREAENRLIDQYDEEWDD